MITDKTTSPIFYHCVWYAWGQADAGVKLVADAFAFGTYYTSLFEPDDSRFIPSVQSAFKTWNKS